MHHPTRSWRALAAAFSLASIIAIPPAAAQTRITPPDCATTPAVEPRVALVYPSLPAESSVATISTPDVLLTVLNTSPTVLDFELIARMDAKGERRQVPLASGTLSGFAAQTVAVALDGMGIQLSSFAFSGHLSIEARVQDTSGRFIDRSFAPELYFHPLTGTSVRIYRDDARRSQYRAGDLSHLVFPSTVPPNVVGVFDGGAGVGSPSEDTGPSHLNAGRADGPLPPVINGAPMWQFCMRWVYESIDSGFGEDHYVSGTLMKARGMHVQIDHPNWAFPKDFIASQDNGCFSFSAAENTGFVITIFAEAYLGDASNIVIRSFESENDAVNNPAFPPTWVVLANPGGSPRRVYYQNQPSELSNLMALGSFVFYWNDVYTEPGLAGPATMFLIPDNNSCGGSAGSCQPVVDGWSLVEIEPGRTNRKFLIGHEVGHWLHREWTNDDMGYNNFSWDGDSPDADCAFNGVGAHAMRSREYSVGGFSEGFAHYLSALAWNRHDQTGGIFKYYKEVEDTAYEDMADDNWLVDLEGVGVNPLGGVSSWMENMCGGLQDGYSVEMDWLRFYWDYRTDSGTKPTHWQILRQIQFMRTNHPWANNITAYDTLEDAIQDMALGQGALLDRFQDLAEDNGVAQ